MISEKRILISKLRALKRTVRVLSYKKTQTRMGKSFKADALLGEKKIQGIIKSACVENGFPLRVPSISGVDGY